MSLFFPLCKPHTITQIGLLVFEDLQDIWVWFPEKLTYAVNIQKHPSWLSIQHEILLSS